MLILRSFNNAWRFAELRPTTRSVHYIPWWRTLLWRDIQGDGWYSKLGEYSVFLYRDAGDLFLQVETDVLLLDDNVTAELRYEDAKCTLRIFRFGELLFTVCYQRPEPWPPLSRDLTAGVEEELVDFGLFIRNVINNPERRQQLAVERS